MSKQDERLPYSEIGRDEMALLYSWDFDDAWPAQQQWEMDHPGEPRGPLYRWDALQRVEACRQAFQQGDKAALMAAIFECSMDGLPLPAWIAQAMINAHREIRHYKAGSWDDVFGKPHPKGTHVRAKRKQRENEFLVLREVKKLSEDGMPVDVHMFEHVGKQLGIGGSTLVKDYYYGLKDRLKLPGIS